jgi:hypothetical protein
MLLRAIFNCGALYCIVWLFERKRINMRDFSPADVVLWPCVALIVPQLLALFVPMPLWVRFGSVLLFVGVSFWTFWKQLPTTRLRAASYCALLLASNIGLDLLLSGGRSI